MVYCPNCGTSNQDDANFCNTCGGEIRYDGESKPKFDPRQSYSQPSSQQNYNPSYSQPSRYQNRGRYIRDETSPVTYICAFCVPIVGIVLWFVWREERPNTANNVLVLSIIGFIINFFLGFASGI